MTTRYVPVAPVDEMILSILMENTHPVDIDVLAGILRSQHKQVDPGIVRGRLDWLQGYGLVSLPDQNHVTLGTNTLGLTGH
ncbi:MAG: hypothetical protein KBD21_03955 [Candidatus Pacebacteria bacterium]|nr:hypothetical protein [Candidatus Paceibacterota bacterium]